MREPRGKLPETHHSMCAAFMVFCWGTPERNIGQHRSWRGNQGSDLEGICVIGWKHAFRLLKTKTSLYVAIPTGAFGNPLQYSCLEDPMGRGVWRAIVHGVPKSQTWLKWLSTYTHTPFNLANTFWVSTAYKVAYQVWQRCNENLKMYLSTSLPMIRNTVAGTGLHSWWMVPHTHTHTHTHTRHQWKVRWQDHTWVTVK